MKELHVMTYEEMLDMPLNTIYKADDNLFSITRVPGGWIYRFMEPAEYGVNYATNSDCIFVPEVKEKPC